MKNLSWRSGALIAALGGVVAWTAAPTPAEACGGTFCDAGPSAMPVDQSGENILFIVDGQEVEVHIQIQYEGDPEKFAWVIPLTAVPEFSIGSEPLFANLLAGTVPTYGFTTTQDQCPAPMPTDVPEGDPAQGDSGFGTGADDGDNGGGGPQVVHRETLGAYEIAVLQGGTAEEVVEWLDENGYQQDPEATPILDEYLSEGHLFGAIKLTGGADVDQIHPIVLRFSSDEACVPLRLTRIAAVDDMEIRTFFLGDERMVPTNYRHVLVNPLKIDWLSLADNYKEVITAAVDAEHANGRAFVTEYAGPSDVISDNGLRDAAWDAADFRGLAPTQIANRLQNQNLAFCSDWDGCQLNHPLIGSLLGEFLPLPEGVSIEQFLDCPNCYEIAEWDSEGFADAFEERIIDPGAHARALLAQWGYATRMYTTISPHEMTKDPIFHPRGDLDDVTATRQGARRIRCNNDSIFTLPDGREVYIPNGGTWPEFPNQMPWEEEVSEIPLSGAPMMLATRTAEIDTMLEEYNREAGLYTDSCQGCQIEGESQDPARSWAFGAVFMLLGAGAVARRRQRS